ncbi:MAG: GNAT family N-acetyltransferase [Gammaproteobacteria bacterium]|nr:GNAT family N-acetyltransferase [Gammaproteobacteria bacterium]
MALTPDMFEKLTRLIAGDMVAGHYAVRLANSDAEIAAAQKLRYEVLFQESGGRVTREMLNTEREEDEWDNVAYHVIVIDTEKQDQVVGTVRLVSNTNLKEGQRFYTEHAFNIDRLRARYDSILELSRACVSPDGRGGAILMLMWKFTIQFIEHNNYQLLFGCASFKGIDYQAHTDILSYLYHNNLATAQLMPVPTGDVDSVAIADFKQPPTAGEKHGKVPTLLRGYLKIGARISEHAIIDPVFNTTFVAIYVDAQEMFQSDHALVTKALPEA